MRLASVESLKPGDQVARTIWSADGTPFLAAGQVIQAGSIRALHGSGISRIYVDDPVCADVELDTIISTDTRALCREVLAEAFDGTPRVRELRRASQQLARDVAVAEQRILSAVEVFPIDDYLVEHSIQSAIVALLIGRALGYPDQQLTNLALGMLVHDIGNLQSPQGLLRAPRELSGDEAQELHVHPREGFTMLREVLSSTPLGRSLALYHHERLDGSGYPRGLMAEDIPEFGRIAGVADVFSALVSDRYHRSALTPDRALAHILEQADKFDAHIAGILARQIAVYPAGMPVELDTGDLAVVMRIDHRSTVSPVVRLLRPLSGGAYRTPRDLDLSLHTDVKIVQARLD